MTPEEKERLQGAVKEIAAILYKNTSPSELNTLSPFLSNKRQAQIKDDPDKLKVV